MDAAVVLDLDRPEAALAVDHEVDLTAGLGAPVVELQVGVAVVDPGAQVLCDQAFECGTADLLGAIQGPGRPDRAEDAGIEPIELRVAGELPLRTALEHGEAERQQQSSSSSHWVSPSLFRMFSSTRAGTTTRTNAEASVNDCHNLAWLRWAGCGLWAIGVVALGVALWSQARQYGSATLSRARNFYGVLTVFKRDASDMKFMELMHGKTEHGLQFLDPVRAAWPTAYYSERSGVGIALSVLPAGNRRIGLVGLGAGTLAAYGQPGDYLRFYEINPDVLRLARSPFTYLANCKSKWDVVLGDARLSLERESPQEFDLLVLDAFSSDAIPVHLLTEQAFQVYERHIKTNGLMAFHISNGHLNLEPVVANLARRFNHEFVIIDQPATREQWWNQGSVWMLLSRNDALINLPVIREASRPPQPVSGTVPLWTDDFASLFQIIRWSASPQMEVRPAEAEVEVAAKLTAKGDAAGAIARYRRALELDPNLVEALNNLTWVLATCSDASLRNGAEAVQLGEKACQLTSYRRTMLVGTLAAAYAEAGRFSDAIATAQKACDLASVFKEDDLLAKNRQLLELYRSGKPYHETGQTAEK